MSSLPQAIITASPTLARLTAKPGSARAVNLHKASHQWASRPAEERFWNLADAANAAQRVSDRLTLSDAHPEAYDLSPRQGKPALVHKASNTGAPLSPLAFDQLSRLAGAPAAYLKTLPAELASYCLKTGWDRYRSDDRLRLQILDHGTSSVQIRAVTSTSHDLTPNSRILRALDNLAKPGSGWKLPPARAPEGWTGPTKSATADDVLTHAGLQGLSPKAGDIIAPSGVYASDRDMFCVLVDDSNTGTIEDDGGLHRFIMVGNSETATGALDVTTGWMRGICGNHIIWGARDILNLRAVHRGDNASRSVNRLACQIERRAWGDDRSETAAHFAALRATQLAQTKDELIALLFTKKRITTRENAALAWDVNSELHSLDGATGSAWGVLNALTRMSQATSYASDRNDLDASAAKVAELVSVN